MAVTDRWIASSARHAVASVRARRPLMGAHQAVAAMAVAAAAVAAVAAVAAAAVVTAVLALEYAPREAVSAVPHGVATPTSW